MNQYLFRLDDACPTMDSRKWQCMEDLLDLYNIQPLVGIIPCNNDPKMKIDQYDNNFWNKARAWQNKGWEIALHGYDHNYISSDGLNGLNPLWERSEFAGVSLSLQREKIKAGLEIFRENQITPSFFFAPSHTFDENTLLALKEESTIRYISDTIGRNPYKMDDFVIIPQLGGRCVEIKIPGIWTFCFHPNMMDEHEFEALEAFLERHKTKCISFKQIDYKNVGEKDVFSKVLSWLYFKQRRVRGIR